MSGAVIGAGGGRRWPAAPLRLSSLGDNQGPKYARSRCPAGARCVIRTCQQWAYKGPELTHDPNFTRLRPATGTFLRHAASPRPKSAGWHGHGAARWATRQPDRQTGFSTPASPTRCASSARVQTRQHYEEALTAGSPRFRAASQPTHLASFSTLALLHVIRRTGPPIPVQDC